MRNSPPEIGPNNLPGAVARPDAGPGAPTFVADAMLGRLAKWLRLFGYDTLYARQETDHQIAALARAQGRVVLTRDRGMAQRRGIRCLLIDSEVLEQQVRQVAAAFGLPSPDRAARCPQCNGPLEIISPEDARPHVPPYVYQTQRRFHRCDQCSRTYWPGTHWQHIEETRARILAGMESSLHTPAKGQPYGQASRDEN